jgi:hypothetical protein
MSTFSSPQDGAGRVNRWFRRGSSGLVGGRSEAARQVLLNHRRRESRGLPGADGAAGTPGAEGLSRGYKIWETPHLSGSGGQAAAFGTSVDFQTTAYVPILATTDLDALPKAATRATFAGGFSNYDVGGMFLQVGNGSGRGGFHMVAQFGTTLYPAGAWWFVGVHDGSSSLAGQPSSFVNLIGVGQDVSDTSPFLMHNDGSGSATRVATGFASIVVGRLYEIELFADPFGTGVDITFRAFSGGLLSGEVSTHASSNLPSGLVTPFYLAGTSTTSVETAIVRTSMFAELQPWPT